MSHFQLHVLKGIAIYTEIVTELVDFFHYEKRPQNQLLFMKINRPVWEITIYKKEECWLTSYWVINQVWKQPNRCCWTLLNAPAMSEKKLFRPSAWVRIARQIQQPPYARPCDRGSSIMLSLGAKKCPPKKKLSKQEPIVIKLNLDLGLFPNCRLLPTLLLLRTHKKTASIKESRVWK